MTQFRLGFACANGTGVPRDYYEAYIWYSLALAGGLVSAEGKRGTVARRLSSAALSAAKNEIKRHLENILQPSRKL